MSGSDLGKFFIYIFRIHNRNLKLKYFLYIITNILLSNKLKFTIYIFRYDSDSLNNAIYGTHFIMDIRGLKSSWFRWSHPINLKTPNQLNYQLIFIKSINLTLNELNQIPMNFRTNPFSKNFYLYNTLDTILKKIRNSAEVMWK